MAIPWKPLTTRRLLALIAILAITLGATREYSRWQHLIKARQNLVRFWAYYKEGRVTACRISEVSRERLDAELAYPLPHSTRMTLVQIHCSLLREVKRQEEIDEWAYLHWTSEIAELNEHIDEAKNLLDKELGRSPLNLADSVEP